MRNIVPFPTPHRDALADDIQLDDITVVAALPARAATRAQLRVPLVDHAEAERNLMILAGAVERSLRLVRSSKRTKDPAALEAVRQVLAQANGSLNLARVKK